MDKNNYTNQKNIKLDSSKLRDLEEIFECNKAPLHIEFNPFIDPENDDEDYSGSAFSMI